MPLGVPSEFTGGGGTTSGGGGGSGTVTSVSVVTANGLAGTVATPTTTPAITLSTSVTGVLKGNGTTISAAVAGTDYLTVLTGDVTTSGNAATLVGTANVESIIRANTLDQMGAPAANVTWNSKKLNSLASGILSTDAPNLGQLAQNQMPAILTGCVWTADSSGSTLNGSMTSGTISIKGIVLTVAAVTSRAFTASKDTYVDFQDNGDGTATITYTEVANNATSPALPNSGTALNTLRCAIIVSTGSALTTGTNTINQGSAATAGTTAAATTVAAGSNGQQIGSLTSNQLSVAANSLATAGYARVDTSLGADPFQAVIKYTGGGGTTTLTGVSLISGTSTGTVSTGGSVTQLAVWSVTDSEGNIIAPSNSDPGIIGSRSFITAGTSTLTTALNVAQLTTPFIVPPGPPRRRIKATANIGYIASSATAGTTITANLFVDGTSVMTVNSKVAVASDGTALFLVGTTTLAPGSHTATLQVTQGAAGTLTFGVSLTTTEQIIIELV